MCTTAFRTEMTKAVNDDSTTDANVRNFWNSLK